MVAMLLLWLFLLSLHQSSAEDEPRPECLQEVDHCDPIPKPAQCLGVSLPYSHTSPILAGDSSNVTDALRNLNLWTGLRNVPKCWEVVQPLLCSVYVPKCVEKSNKSSVVYLPPKEFCDITRGPCKIVETYGWPAFLNCNQSHYISRCTDTSAVKGLSFNTTGTCEAPLVTTENRNSWYKDVDGCGVQCKNPLFTDKEHSQMHIFIAVCGSLCLACTLFTLLTFIIDWKNSSRYPALILFFINGCFFIGSLGWMAQFVPGARDDIVCRSDGTMRITEPQLGSGETASCSVVFFVVYFFMIAGCIWFVILAYCWHLLFSNMRSPIKYIEAKRGTFHMFAWSLPLILTIVCLALTQIDGDSMTGICFVGGIQHGYRAGFVLAPIALVIIIGLIFLMSGLVKLIKMKVGSPGVISDKASAKITDTIIRLGVFAVMALLFVIVTFGVHLYIFTNEKRWLKSFEEYIFCEANVTDVMSRRSTPCLMHTRPSLIAMQMHVLAYFGTGVVMSSWVWNTNTLRTWKRFLRKCWGLPDAEPMKVKKHHVIAQAFSKRGEMNQGRLSLSFQSMHDDPLGMRFDLNSVSSREVSSVWAAAIPRLIQRRGGVDQRRHSDSDVQSIQSVMDQISGIISESESRRLSVQSQNSGDKQSHNSSGQEEKTVAQVEQRPRRKRRKRKAVHRTAPLTDAVANAVSSRLGSLERVSSLGTGSDLRPQSSSLCTPDDAAEHSDSPASSHKDGVINMAYEETQCTINRAFHIQASPTSAFSPFRSTENIAPPSPCTLSIASSDTEAMSVKDYVSPEPKIPSLIQPIPLHPNFMMFPPNAYNPQQPGYPLPPHMYPPQYPSYPSPPVPPPHQQHMPYTIPQHFTALHAHTTYSMLHGGMYRGFNPNLLETPFLPFGVPVPPVPIKRSAKQHSPQKSQKSESETSDKFREEEPRLMQPTPTSLHVTPHKLDVIDLDSRSPMHFPVPQPSPVKPPSHFPVPQPSPVKPPSHFPVPQPSPVKPPSHFPVPQPSPVKPPSHFPMPQPSPVKPPSHFPMPQPSPVKPQPMTVFDIEDDREGGGGKVKKRRRTKQQNVVINGTEYAETTA